MKTHPSADFERNREICACRASPFTPRYTATMEPKSPQDFHHSESRATAIPAVFPRISQGLARIGGILKSAPCDFQVEEIPAYFPAGNGEHLFLWIEKENLTTDQLVRHLARTLGAAPGDIGTAGLKDKRAVTRQFVSVPAQFTDRVDSANSPQIRVLSARRHPNKLRTGHLRGNRFSILVRDVTAGSMESALAVVERIRDVGFPNYYGQQRYGIDGETLDLGWRLLRGETSPKSISYTRRKFLLRLALSAVQSSLFDQTLSARISDGLFAKVLMGDVMQVCTSNGVFIAEDVEIEQDRFEAGEIAITGPMYGPKMCSPAGDPAAREAAILSANNISPSDFERFAKLTSGTRRPYAIRPDNLSISAEEPGLRFRFTLPPGAYATTLLREFLVDGDNTECANSEHRP